MIEELVHAIIRYFFPCLINIIVVIYVLCKIMDKKVPLNKPITYLVLIFLTISTIINYMYIDNFMRFFTSLVEITIGSYLLFRDDLYRTFLCATFEQIIMFVSEMTLMVIFILVFGANTEQVFANQGTLLANLEISAIAIALINFRPLLRLVRKITSHISESEGMQKYFLIVILMITLNILLALVYLNAGNINILMINLSFIIIYSYIVYVSLHEKNKNMIFQNQNKVLIDNLSEYEKMLDHQKVANHENKNQFLAIKGMYQKNEDILPYIDTIISVQEMDDENLYGKTARIPSGGIQGIVYQKMIEMEKKEIKPTLNISKSIENLDFTNVKAKLNYDICRVLGVLLDNAIEETEKLENNPKEINISMYAEQEDLFIEISNFFTTMPALDKMGERGYTTKTKGHGYGLSLVKDIIENNKKLACQKQILGNIFTQVLKIKM